MKTICFDIEATDRGEILELSIFRHSDSKEIYHSYFKPVRSRQWSVTEKIHHITPAMVADSPRFSKERKRVQALVDSTECIVGFAVANDLKYLRESGIHIPETMKILDVRDMFWIARGKEQGFDFNNVPRLSVCAGLMGCDFSEENDAHSATNDTRMTLRLFSLLAEEMNRGVVDVAFCDMIARRIREGEAEYRRTNAKGFISVVPAKGGFSIKNNHIVESEVPEGGYRIEVESRFIAEYDLRQKFAKRELRNSTGIYSLTKADIDYFTGYTNSYDETRESILRSLLHGRRPDSRDAISFLRNR